MDNFMGYVEMSGKRLRELHSEATLRHEQAFERYRKARQEASVINKYRQKNHDKFLLSLNLWTRLFGKVEKPIEAKAHLDSRADRCSIPLIHYENVLKRISDKDLVYVPTYVIEDFHMLIIAEDLGFIENYYPLPCKIMEEENNG